MGLREVVEPTGGLPPSVYWLRRAAVALPVLAVVFVIVVLATRSSSPSPTSAVSALPASTPPSSFTLPTTPTSASTTPASTAPSTGTTPSTTTPTPTRATTAVTAVCPASSLAVSVAPSARSYAVGALVRFTTTLRSTGPACTATGAVALVVTSGSDRLWSSTDCVAAHTATTSLPAGHAAGALRSWNQVRTLPHCTKVVGTKIARAGSYRVVATWDGVTSAPVTFHLR